MADDRGAALSVRLAQPGPIPLDAAFDCAPGELLALVGPSGSGKTTVLRSIAGLYRPLEGRVACGNEIWFDAGTRICRTPQRRSVGLVFQNYALFPHLSALANVAAALGHRAPGDRNARARELLELVHLGGLEARLPSALSGGQQQRVAVARALARDPQVLLMDEPFSAVDRVTRQKLYRELAELRRALKMPLVLVTHDLDEAASLADRMCILYRGRTLQIGSPDEIMSRPDNALIARLVDLKNVFEGKVLSHEGERGRTLLQWQGHTLELSYTPQYAVGSPVCWAIPAASVVLHRLRPAFTKRAAKRPRRHRRELRIAGSEHEPRPAGRRRGRQVSLPFHSHASCATQRHRHRPTCARLPAGRRHPPYALGRSARAPDRSRCLKVSLADLRYDGAADNVRPPWNSHLSSILSLRSRRTKTRAWR